MGRTCYKAVAWVAALKYAHVLGMVLWSEVGQDRYSRCVFGVLVQNQRFNAFNCG